MGPAQSPRPGCIGTHCWIFGFSTATTFLQGTVSTFSIEAFAELVFSFSIHQYHPLVWGSSGENDNESWAYGSGGCTLGL